MNPPCTALTETIVATFISEIYRCFSLLVLVTFIWWFTPENHSTVKEKQLRAVVERLIYQWCPVRWGQTTWRLLPLWCYFPRGQRGLLAELRRLGGVAAEFDWSTGQVWGLSRGIAFSCNHCKTYNCTCKTVNYVFIQVKDETPYTHCWLRLITLMVLLPISRNPTF